MAMTPEYGWEKLNTQESERLREQSEGLLPDEREDAPERVVEERELEDRELGYLDPDDNEAHLAGRVCLVVIGVEVSQLPILELPLLYHALGRVLAFIWQEALGLLPQALGLLRVQLFPAVLGRHCHRAPLLWVPCHPSLTPALARLVDGPSVQLELV